MSLCYIVVNFLLYQVETGIFILHSINIIFENKNVQNKSVQRSKIVFDLDTRNLNIILTVMKTNSYQV